jgi:hypothetical protein
VNDLRDELTAYVQADEPPVRLEFQTVLTAAKRSRRGHQAGRIAGLAAGVALVAGVVPVVIRPHSPPDALATAIADCARPSVGEPADRYPYEPAPSRVDCVLNAIMAKNLPGSFGMALVQKGDSGRLVRLYAAHDKGQVEIVISRGADSTMCFPSQPPCTRQRGPNGESAEVMREQLGGLTRWSATAFHNGTRVSISATNRATDRLFTTIEASPPTSSAHQTPTRVTSLPSPPPRAEPPLTIDQLVEIVTNAALVL